MRQITAAIYLVVLALTQARAASHADDGNSLFNLNCAPCHSKDGKARTPAARKLGVKDLTLSKLGDDEIARQIRDGRKGPDGTQQMPSFGERLTPEQVKLLVNYVKKFRKSTAR